MIAQPAPSIPIEWQPLSPQGARCLASVISSCASTGENFLRFVDWFLPCTDDVDDWQEQLDLPFPNDEPVPEQAMTSVHETSLFDRYGCRYEWVVHYDPMTYQVLAHYLQPS